MAAISTQQIGIGGNTPTYAAATAGGDTFSPDARTFLHIKNGGASPMTATIQTFGSDPGGNPGQNRALTIPNGSERMIGPFPAAAFADATSTAYITYSAVLTVTIAALRL